MEFDNATNDVYSNKQMTPGNTGFERDVILSPTHDHLYAHTAKQVPSAGQFSLLSSPAVSNMRDASASVAWLLPRETLTCVARYCCENVVRPSGCSSACNVDGL